MPRSLDILTESTASVEQVNQRLAARTTGWLGTRHLTPQARWIR